jgi:hypothetical protein
MTWPTRETGWLLGLMGVLVYFVLCVLHGGGNWYLLGFSYALLWPTVFVFTILPGAAVGAHHIRTWQEGVVLTEMGTITAALVCFTPSFRDLLLFGQALIMVHLALFVPLLLSILIGAYFGRSR